MSSTLLNPTPLSLGEEMKSIEKSQRRQVPVKAYTIIRLDGRGFSRYTKPLNKPFDRDFAADMLEAAQLLAEHVQGVALGYVASDEVSLVLTDFSSPGTQQWMGGDSYKMVSLSAAYLSTQFSRLRMERGFEPAVFDSRVVSMTDPTQVARYLLWRQKDTMRNAVTMAARARFSHRSLNKKSTLAKLRMLSAEGVYFDNLPSWARLGTLLQRQETSEEVTWTDPRTGLEQCVVAVRRPWVQVNPGVLAVDTLLAGSLIPRPSSSVEVPVAA